VLPGVSVTASSPAPIGGARNAVTGESGGYQLITLPPGTYDIVYELTGFTTLKREGIFVRVAQITRVDVELAVGAVQEA
jgi:hypothetical protein